ncbi:CGNR zinc finger domain-containing protein [Roseibium sp. SCP14]|uniref:CGNR zinc finger domain-containing protein n=1 Tax=Roseibium sp. SCP14 TaxID=3141375 RepID=UPI0033375B3F
MKIPLTLISLEEAMSFAIDLANTHDPMREPVDSLADADTATEFLQPLLEEKEDAVRIGRELRPHRDILRKAFLDFAAGLENDQSTWQGLETALESDWKLGQDGEGKLSAFPGQKQSAVKRLVSWSALGFFALMQGAPERVRVCQSAPCEEVFHDKTKAGRQRFCSKRCGTRFNVAQYRSRERDSG